VSLAFAQSVREGFQYPTPVKRRISKQVGSLVGSLFMGFSFLELLGL
jgi:hypothetical protein